MGRLTEQRAAKAEAAALQKSKSTAVNMMTQAQLEEAYKTAWGGPNSSGDSAYMQDIRNEMAKRGTLTAFEESQKSPNYTLGNILKDARTFYGTALLGTAGMGAINPATTSAASAAGAGTGSYAGLNTAIADASGYSLAPGATTGMGMSPSLAAGVAETAGYSAAPELLGGGGVPTVAGVPNSPSTSGVDTTKNYLNAAGDVVGLVSSVNQMTGGDNLDPNAARNATDPFAPYRSKYASQLDSLLSNPASVTTLPGYTFLQQQGEQGVMRTLAAQGRTVSGNELLALREQDQALANKMYNQEAERLAMLSGANQSPSAGGTAFNTTGTNNTTLQQAGANATAQNLGALANNPVVQNAAGKVWDWASSW